MIELSAVVYLDPDATGVPRLEMMSTSRLMVAVELIGYVASSEIRASRDIAIGEEQEAHIIFPYGEIFRSKFYQGARYSLVLGVNEVGYIRVISIVNSVEEWTYDEDSDTLRKLEEGENVKAYFEDG